MLKYSESRIYIITDIIFDFIICNCYIVKNQGQIMKKFLKYIAVILIAFCADFFSKAGLLGFLAAKYGDMV